MHEATDPRRRGIFSRRLVSQYREVGVGKSLDEARRWYQTLRPLLAASAAVLLFLAGLGGFLITVAAFTQDDERVEANLGVSIPTGRADTADDNPWLICAIEGCSSS